MRGKEDDGPSFIGLRQPTAAYRSGGLLGHADDRWMGNMYCGWMDALPLPVMQITRELPFDLTQHPFSLYCTLKKETTASALSGPAVGLSITCMEDIRYEIPKYWVRSEVVRSMVAAGTDTMFGLSISPQSWCVQPTKMGKI